MAALTSTIYTDPARWQNPNPGYAACLAVVGGGVNTGSEDVANSISNIATRSPVLLACIITGDPEYIYVLNSSANWTTSANNWTKTKNLLPGWIRSRILYTKDSESKVNSMFH